MTTIEVRNHGTFEVDLGEGVLLAPRAIATVNDEDPTVQAYIADGVLVETVPPAEPDKPTPVETGDQTTSPATDADPPADAVETTPEGDKTSTPEGGGTTRPARSAGRHGR